MRFLKSYVYVYTHRRGPLAKFTSLHSVQCGTRASFESAFDDLQIYPRRYSLPFSILVDIAQ